MDLDLRKLRYFVAVAELKHFGAAAQQLHIAQPVLSRQIRALERELGCELLTRTTRSVELTPAGDQLLNEARSLLVTVDSAVRRVHEVDCGLERLIVAFAPGLHVSEPVRAFAAMHTGVQIELLPLKWWEQDAPMRDGRADVGYLRCPFDNTGLMTIPVGNEAKVVCIPLTHPLSGCRAVRMVDLDGENILDARARRTSSIEEKLELISVGYGIAIMPRTVAAHHPRPDLAYLDVVDAEPFETCIAVADGRREGRVHDFVALAIDILGERPGLSAGDRR